MKYALCVLTMTWAAGVAAQQPAASNVPVIHAKLSSLGTIRDTSSAVGAMMPRGAALSPLGQLIAFDTDKDLRVWNPASKSSAVLMTGSISDPVWSRAGDAILFNRENEQGTQEFVWSVRVDPSTGKARGTPQRVSLSPTTGRGPQFSPDGRSIAYPRRDPERRSSLVVVPSAGGTERVLATGFSVRRVSWSADGSSLYFVASPDSTESKFILNRVALSGGAPQVIGSFDSPPGLSADGRRVELQQRRSIDGNSIVVKKLTGESLTKLGYPGDVSIPDPSPAAHRLGIRNTYPRGLRIMSLSDEKSRQLFDSSAEVAAATWYPDARRIAVMTFREGVYAIETMNVDGSGLKRVRINAVPDYVGNLDSPRGPLLQVSPDGRYASFVGWLRGSLEVVDLATGNTRTLASGEAVLTPYWSADSKSIRYIRVDAFPIAEDNRGVHEVTLNGEDRLLRPLPASQYPRVVWGLDENTIVSFGDFGHSVIPLAGGKPIVTTRNAVQGAGLLSHDRKTIAIRTGVVNANMPARRITLVSLVDSTHRELDLPFLDIGLMAFDAENRNLYIRGRSSEGAALDLYAVPLDGSAPRIVAPMNTREQQGIFIGSPDGRSILYSMAAPRSATFLKVDFSEGLSKLAERTKP